MAEGQGPVEDVSGADGVDHVNVERRKVPSSAIVKPHDAALSKGYRQPGVGTRWQSRRGRPPGSSMPEVASRAVAEKATWVQLREQ